MNEEPPTKPPQQNPVYIAYPGTNLPQVHVRLNAIEVHVSAPTTQEAVGAMEHVLKKINVKVEAEGYTYG
jgi:hypothetical protein